MKMLLLKLSCLIAMTVLAFPIGAQGKVAYVDIERVTEHSRAVNKTFSDIEQKMKAFQDEVDAKTKLLTSLRAEIRKGEGVLAESALKKKKDEAAKLDEELTELQYKGKRDFQRIDATLFEPTIKAIILTIKEVAEEKKIDLVLRGEVVIYASDSVDITDAVIAKMNVNAGINKTNVETTGTTAAPKTQSVIQKSILPSLEKPANGGEAPNPASKRPVDRQKD